MDELPLRPPEESPPPRPVTPAPPWVALACAWAGLLTLTASIVLPLLPGSRSPRQELERRVAYSFADRWLPFPVYLSVVALFLGIIVFWQMRKEPRPLPPPMAVQRLQAWVGIVLALLAIVFIYVWVYFFVAWRGAAK